MAALCSTLTIMFFILIICGIVAYIKKDKQYIIEPLKFLLFVLCALFCVALVFGIVVFWCRVFGP